MQNTQICWLKLIKAVQMAGSISFVEGTRLVLAGLTVLWSVVSCKNSTPPPAATLFQSLDKEETNIDFANDLAYNASFNVYTYRNFYNGGGVAIGDINNDGLPDLFFTANMLPNKLYLNKGNFKFEDITEKAGIRKIGKWSTGVSMADVNGDGWLDIYVCNSGDIKGDNRQNELYINNGPSGSKTGTTLPKRRTNMAWMTGDFPRTRPSLTMTMTATSICSC